MHIRSTVAAAVLAALLVPAMPAFAGGRDRAASEAAPSTPKARFDAIVAKIEADNPSRPKIPGPADEVAGYAAFIVAERTAVPEDRAFLESLKGGKLEGVSDKQLDTWIYRRGYMLERQLEKKLEETRVAVDNHLQTFRDRMNRFREIDPNDTNKQKNLVLKEGAMEKEFGFFADAEAAVALSRQFYAALGADGPDHDAIAKEVADTRAHFQQLADHALASVHMPPDIGDAKLAGIAREVLANDKYGVHPIKQLAVVRGVTHATDERVDGRLGELVVYSYAWDEFTVATAEETSPGTFFIHWNTLKKFTSGSPTTPIGKWILGERFQSSRIPASNL